MSVVNAISQLFVYHDAHGSVAEGRQTSNTNSVDGHFKAIERSIECVMVFLPFMSKRSEQFVAALCLVFPFRSKLKPSVSST